MAEDRGLAPLLPLFVPATRPERFEKARASGAGAIIIDLEDAVAPTEKVAARAGLAGNLPREPGAPVLLRVNAEGTEWFEDDVAAAMAAGVEGIVLPKAEDAARVHALRERLPDGVALYGLIETAKAIGAVRELAPLFERMFFGSLDYAEDLGCAHTDAALLHARGEIVLAARLAGRPAPCDGVTTNTKDPDATLADARRGAELGFRGKLLIHPAQVAPAEAAWRPSDERIDWARRVIEASAASGAVLVDGAMVDAPVVAQARRILALAAATGES